MDGLLTLGFPNGRASCTSTKPQAQTASPRTSWLNQAPNHRHDHSVHCAISSDSTASSSSPPYSHHQVSIDLVLANTYLRAEVFRHLDGGSLSRALTTSKLFFVGAVEELYRDFKHQHHNKLVKRCHDQDRLSLYLGAIRTVDLSEETRTIQISKWENLLSPFPNARQIKRYTDILYRESPLDNNLSGDRYTFEYIYTERLFRGPRRSTLPDAPGRSGIPDHWKQRRRVNLNVYEEQFKTIADEDDRGECLKETIIERMKQLDGPIDSLLINFRVSNHYVLDALRAVYNLGHGTPTRLLLRSIDHALFDILEIAARTLTTIYLPIRQYDATQLGIDDFLLKTPWDRLTQVKHFDIPICRPKSPLQLENDPVQSFCPPNYVPPTTFDEISPLSSNVHLHFIYPPDPELAEKQAKIDIEHLDHLAKALLPILGGGRNTTSSLPSSSTSSCADSAQISATFPQFPDPETGTHLADGLSSRLSTALEHAVRE
ncbi:hypothetical protein I317_05241 [Kwoniella heveanensis CBS 569]|nr:hypothetical protein I317_05241 [Kwoniella heveanensis CBS 569]